MTLGRGLEALSQECPRGASAETHRLGPLMHHRAPDGIGLDGVIVCAPLQALSQLRDYDRAGYRATDAELLRRMDVLYGARGDRLSELRAVALAGPTTVEAAAAIEELADAALVDRPPVCPACLNAGVIERDASPEEVDAGYELGVAYDPCPNEAWHNR